MVIFRNRMNWQPPKEQPHYPMLDPEAYHDARLVAPGYDVYELERQWRDWWVDTRDAWAGVSGKSICSLLQETLQMKPNP